jgi:aspartate kinase
MNIVVQKFGGTSVATKEARQKVIDKIISLKRSEEALPVVVVSAIGRKGSPYATDTLIEFAKEMSGDLDDRHWDLLLSCGEIISAVTIANMLTHKGYQAVALTGAQAGIITNTRHKNADLIETNTNRILDYLKNGVIPVVAGFQGVTLSGEVTTLGRGGSDTSAAILGAALKASRIEIFTDVDGIMTADPRVCDKAKMIPHITYQEIFQMADGGAKVIHPRAVQYAMWGNVPLWIKNTFSEEIGTCISQKRENIEQSMKDNIITGVAHKGDRVQFIIEHKKDKEDLLEVIAMRGISIDLINLFPSQYIFTIDKAYVNILEEYLQEKNYKYSKIDSCCKVTIIGEGMTGIPGVMSKVTKALGSKGIKIFQTVDSLTSISCLIEEDYVMDAVDALHDIFGLS